MTRAARPGGGSPGHGKAAVRRADRSSSSSERTGRGVTPIGALRGWLRPDDWPSDQPAWAWGCACASRQHMAYDRALRGTCPLTLGLQVDDLGRVVARRPASMRGWVKPHDWPDDQPAWSWPCTCSSQQHAAYERALRGTCPRTLGLQVDDYGRVVAESAAGPDASPWSRAVSVSSLLTETDADVDWIAHDVAAPGSITGIASPRGIGKTHVVHALAVAVATGGLYRGERLRQGRVLLIDRDNSRREILRRLRAWGADACGDRLRVLMRDNAPALTDAEAWEVFPFGDYDLVIVDSWGASTEGIEDRDGGRTGAALASLLELARRGPAVVLLLNVPKDAKSFRGSGVIADRLDILFEVRDITDLKPSPKGASWWSTLAEAGESAWQERATRRRRRDDYRLALVASKYRIGEEPEPIALEITLGETWTLGDVTSALVAAHEQAQGDVAVARARTERDAGDTLARLVAERHGRGEVLREADAVAYLQEAGIARQRARDLIAAGDAWRREGAGTRSRPYVLVPTSPTAAARNANSGDPCAAGTSARSILAGTGAQGRQESASSEPLEERGQRDTHCSPSTPASTSSLPANAADAEVIL